MTSYLDEWLNQAAAAAYLQPRMPKHNAIYFLADNRRGQTGSIPRIPYMQKGRKVFYRRGDLIAFAHALTEVPVGAVGELRIERAYTDDAPMVSVKRGAVPVIEVGWFPDPVTLTREAAQELANSLVAAIDEIDKTAAATGLPVSAAASAPPTFVH